MPLLAALAQEQAAAAQMLLDAGAKCNLQDAAVQRTIQGLFSPGARELTAKLLHVELCQLPERCEKKEAWKEETEPDMMDFFTNFETEDESEVCF